MSEEEYFATGPAHERPVFEAVRAHLETVGPVHIEFVSVGIFLKHDRGFAELRPMTRWVALWLLLPRPVRHRLITRKVAPYHGRYIHVVNLARPEDLDNDLRAWLTEAYLAAGS
jgi:uncharacterized protein DUF5655